MSDFQSNFQKHNGATAPRLYDTDFNKLEEPLQKTIWKIVDGVVKIFKETINEETYVLPRWSN